jgi:hypothetical protein
MKAATAQKMILNMITTGAMTRLGYVYDNLMVNVHMKNAKLVERGIRVLMKVCNIDRDTAIRTIKSAGKSHPHRRRHAQGQRRQDGSRPPPPANPTATSASPSTTLGSSCNPHWTEDRF